MGNHVIMIVDDDAFVRNSLERAILEFGDYMIITAPNGEKALALLEKQHVDLIISDHKMPLMTGVDFLSVVKEKFPDAVRILLTGYADKETAINAINKGEVFRFLTKPWDNIELMVTIQEALDHHDKMQEKESSEKKKGKEKEKEQILKELEKEHPGITAVNKELDGSILLPDK